VYVGSLAARMTTTGDGDSWKQRRSGCSQKDTVAPGRAGIDSGGSSRTKRPLSPGATPQDAQSQVKRTKQKQKENHITVRDLLMFLTYSQKFHSTLVRNTRGFTGGWTMGPSVAWFYEGQLRPHRNWKLETS